MSIQKKVLLEVADPLELENILPFLEINGIPFEVETSGNHEMPQISIEATQFFRTRLLVAESDYEFARSLVFEEGVGEENEGLEELRALLEDEESEELKERIIFPERFSEEEVNLAREILAKRGDLPSDSEAKKERNEIIAVEWKPREINIAWTFVLLLATVATPYLAIIFSIHALFTKTPDPDGQKVYLYGPRTRKITWLTLGIATLNLIAQAIWIWKSTQ